MSYTPPNDLFTSEEAILSLASSIADEDRTNLGNGTINGALDVLADALAERNVEVPPMNAGAILALADYVSGGGGGGGDFSTASVAFILDGYTGAPFTFPVPVINPHFGLVAYITSSDMGSDSTYDVVMYNGELFLEQSVDGTKFAASTGSIELQGEGTEAIITGDGTLTISDYE